MRNPNGSTKAVANRVPDIIFLYWVIKIAATTLGETGADMVSMTWNLGYARTIVIFLGIFAALLALKLALKGYHPLLYWLLFTASAIAGTGISDFIDRTLGLGYTQGSALLVALLLLVLWVWQRKEKSIDVESIGTPGAEFYYWMAFLVANTLGTAAGDFLADSLGLGFGVSAAFISGILALIAILHYLTDLPGLLLFWLAFVLTRPFGATFGDLLTKPRDHGGLNLGTVGASLFFGLLLAISVAMEMRRERPKA